jgi:tubby and related proteins
MAQEGQGRQDRKLAVARHRRRRGRSEFIVAQNQDDIFCTSDDKNFLGTVAANLVGSKYQILGQVLLQSTAQASCSRWQCMAD